MDKVLTLETINPNMIKIEYAVRGPIVERALQIEKELKNVSIIHIYYEQIQGDKKSFNEVVKCNIGDCHAIGQRFITFVRQVTALATFPHLLEEKSFPEDAKSRAKDLLAACSGSSVGMYEYYIIS